MMHEIGIESGSPGPKQNVLLINSSLLLKYENFLKSEIERVQS